MVNSAWSPLEIISIADAITGLYLGKAHALDDNCYYHTFKSWLKLWENPEEVAQAKAVGRIVVGSTHLSIVVPEVIVINFARNSKRIARITPENVARRDENKCQYCGKELPRSKLSRDHIFPESRGGQLVWDNIVAACHRCNNKKRDRTPEEAGMKVMRRPFAPHWLMEHMDHAPLLWKTVLKMK